MGRITKTNVAVATATMVTAKVGKEKNIPVILMQRRRKAKLI